MEPHRCSVAATILITVFTFALAGCTDPRTTRAQRAATIAELEMAHAAASAAHEAQKESEIARVEAEIALAAMTKKYNETQHQQDWHGKEIEVLKARLLMAEEKYLMELEARKIAEAEREQADDERKKAEAVLSSVQAELKNIKSEEKGADLEE